MDVDRPKDVHFDVAGRPLAGRWRAFALVESTVVIAQYLVVRSIYFLNLIRGASTCRRSPVMLASGAARDSAHLFAVMWTSTFKHWHELQF